MITSRIVYSFVLLGIGFLLGTFLHPLPVKAQGVVKVQEVNPGSLVGPAADRVLGFSCATEDNDIHCFVASR